MAGACTSQFSVLLSILLITLLGVEGIVPPACKRYECPTYDVIQSEKDYEIRRYNSPVWISNNPQDTSLVGATTLGFRRIFSYIYGNNKEKEEINMTAPVTSEVSVSGGKSSIVVSFYLPKENQANPPSADGLYVQRWKTKYAAVRRFGGFVTDSNIAEQVAALNASIAGTKWSSKVPKTYTVAQYSIPIELFNRVNEVWFLYDSEN